MESPPSISKLSRGVSAPAKSQNVPWYEQESPGGWKPFVQCQEHLLEPTEGNPQPTIVPPPAAGLTGAYGQRLVISFIGLPARCKAFLVERLCRYLAFFHGAKCKVYDIAKLEWKDDPEIFMGLQSFLEEDDELAGLQVMEALDGLLRKGSRSTFGEEDAARKNVDSGRIAILYSSNEMGTSQKIWSGSSKEWRWEMHNQLQKLNVHCKLLFVEVIVTDLELVHQVVVARVGDATAAAQVKEIEDSIKDFTRIFVTIQQDGSEDDLSYMKLINYGSRIVTNRMHGALTMRIVQYLSHVHPQNHTIYLTRHGQSEYNKVHKIGGNPGLTEEGEAYARWLSEWVPVNICGVNSDSEGNQQPCRLWTSSMKRTIETARHIPHPVIKAEGGQPWHQMALRVYRNLDEIFAGEFEGMTYEEIEKTSGDEAILRKKDKLGYRYPRGESYYDLIARLDVLIYELERYHEPLLIVSHQATLRMLYAFLMGIDRIDAPKIDFPLHTVIKIEYGGLHAYSTVNLHHATESRFSFDAGSVSADGQKHL